MASPCRHPLLVVAVWCLATGRSTTERGHKLEKELVGRVPPCRKSPELHRFRLGDEDRQGLIFFSGKGVKWIETLGKTMSYDRHVSFFSGEEVWMLDLQSQQWTELDTFPKASDGYPQGRWKSAATTFNGDGALVLFAGCNTTERTGDLNDLWVFTPSIAGSAASGLWRRVDAANTPEPRRSHTAVANSSHLVIYGGKGGEAILTDVWALPLSVLSHGVGMRARWTRGADFPGGQRWGATATHLVMPEGREVMVVFGGRMKLKKKKRHGVFTHKYFNDLWMYDFEADTWFPIKPECCAEPEPRDHHTAAALNGDLYIFGGRVSEATSLSAVRSDIWSYSLRTNKWTKHPDGPVRPSARYMPGMDAARWNQDNALIIVGGEQLPGTTKTSSLNDVWAYVPYGEDSCAHGRCGWTELRPPQCALDDQLPTSGWNTIMALAGSALLVGLVVCLYERCIRRKKGARGRELESTMPYFLLH